MKNGVRVAMSGQAANKSLNERVLDHLKAVELSENGSVYAVELSNSLIYELERELQQSKFNKQKYMDIKTNNPEIKKRIENENNKIIKLGGQVELLNQIKDIVLEDFKVKVLAKLSKE